MARLGDGQRFGRRRAARTLDRWPRRAIAPYGCEELVVGASHDYLLAANWKLPIENYHECYHCPTIQPELCNVSPPTSGDNYDLPGAWFGGTMDLAAHAETMSMSGKSLAGFLPGLDATRRRQVLYAGIFPNLLLSLHPDYVMTHRVEPRSPGVSLVECQWLFTGDTVARADFDPAYAVDFWHVTNAQDWNACEGIQRGVTSPASGRDRSRRPKSGAGVRSLRCPRLPRRPAPTHSLKVRRRAASEGSGTCCHTPSPPARPRPLRRRDPGPT